MKFSLIRGRFVFVVAVVTLVLMGLPAVPARAESGSSSSAGELLFWLLGFTKARDHARVEKLDVNSASVEELAAVPGLDRRQARRITDSRPYAKLEDLRRAGVSSRLIGHLAGFLVVAQASPSASPRSPDQRRD